ncbi:MAG: hypothetical protein SGARI_006712, partial [Bacillariaceae sp.]
MLRAGFETELTPMTSPTQLKAIKDIPQILKGNAKSSAKNFVTMQAKLNIINIAWICFWRVGPGIMSHLWRKEGTKDQHSWLSGRNTTDANTEAMLAHSNKEGERKS